MPVSRATASLNQVWVWVRRLTGNRGAAEGILGKDAVPLDLIDILKEVEEEHIEGPQQ
jgi:hypothetical protein